MIIEPRILKGFRDSLPSYELHRRDLIHTLENNFRSFGFEPIDTPILEYSEVLLGKGSGETDKQIYRFQDNGGRDVAMRFDLTVPFARFMAAHVNELYEPFRRYHIAKVWRGENTQKGRYREFYQCDFDIVGTDSLSADFEILLMMYSSLKRIGISSFVIKIAHRGIFNLFLDHNGITDKSAEILRIVDKLTKIGRDEVVSQLTEIVGASLSGQILEFIEPKGSFRETFNTLVALSGGESEHSRRIEQIFSLIASLELDEYFQLDPSITRGLDYYTGIVFETILTDNPAIGSVCSGGRYNELASLYTKRSLPGVGSSIGLDRLLAALEDSRDTAQQTGVTDLLIFHLDDELLPEYHRLAEQARSTGCSTEVYPVKKKLQQQFKYAEKKRIPFGLFVGSHEQESGLVTLKDLFHRQEHADITLKQALNLVRQSKE
ncbi:MAG: histidine--tRNA ligase [Spirochaetota bacterium]